ncbi:hypothetical protein H4R23_004592 [Coemansia sp. Cherry 401B]|nr:hypothetical protein IWW54_004934 [Coemansia sp. RSA 2705]KAJ2362066.1 hypothetical protein H4S01_004965 [Coemansia sp. RSA 2610]KAJ2721407.1 hypothetical protein H4R23_004592 [Coemansia sp. Cherry 401B]
MLQSIKQIVRDLETIVIENARSDESKNNNAAPAKAADTPDEDSGQPVFSLEAEEAWEKEQAKKARHKRHIVAADEREKRVTAEQREREDRVKWSAMRELDGIEEMQRRQDAMATALAKWNDPREEQLGEHDYYRDRQRWWRHRKAERAREIELDEADRRQQERDDRANDKDAAGAAGRRDMIEALIKEIPSDPKALFDWPVKWQHVDAALIQSKIEPAVRKRLTEYLGSEGDDSSVDELTEYVATCIKERKRPQELINELEMVLVEEAPVFVARIWRFVVYESEAQARSVG